MTFIVIWWSSIHSQPSYSTSAPLSLLVITCCGQKYLLCFPSNLNYPFGVTALHIWWNESAMLNVKIYDNPEQGIVSIHSLIKRERCKLCIFSNMNHKVNTWRQMYSNLGEKSLWFVQIAQLNWGHEFNKGNERNISTHFYSTMFKSHGR